MNFFISIVGWFLWNWAQLTMEKKMLDEDGNPQTNFTFKDYINKQYTYWVGSLICVPVLLWIGYRNLNIDPLASLIGIDAKIGWHDAYLLGSGAAFEAVIFIVSVIRNYFKKKQ
jgi:hypothetical protein